MSIPQKKSKLKYISPDKIQPNPENPRVIFREEEMDTLLQSIVEHGIQVPVSVFEDEGIYYLIDGERRWRCAQKLNLREIPAVIQDRPSPLQNLLLMYNIHALREQWDYFTIAKSLSRIIDLFYTERGYRPNEIELSESTGLTRGQIRRCNLIIDLPDKYKNTIEKELLKPKFQQKLTEDFFIEMERSLKTVFKRIDELEPRQDDIRDALITKFTDGTISAVTDFRLLSKIATAVENLGLKYGKAKKTLNRVFDPDDALNIKRAYHDTVEFEYDERKAFKYIELLDEFIGDIEEDHKNEIDEDFFNSLKKLGVKIQALVERFEG